MMDYGMDGLDRMGDGWNEGGEEEWGERVGRGRVGEEDERKMIWRLPINPWINRRSQ